jgi:hypothetical protein
MNLLRYIASLLRRRTTQAPPAPVNYTGTPSRWRIGANDPKPVRPTVEYLREGEQPTRKG